MSHLLFVDESGHDQRDSPYEVLAGITVEDARLWSLINAVQALEVKCFGERYSDGKRELKAKKILKRKVFKHAAQLPPIDPAERAELARECLINGSAATRAQLTALAQAKLAFVEGALKLCLEYRCSAIAILVTRNAPRPTANNVLRKDYAYLLERFYYFLKEQKDHHQGLVVFDELERSQSHLLLDQLARYFTTFTTGAERASRVIPEPFFVHSHLTTGVQLADLIAYIAAWGMQVGSMDPPARPELAALGALVARLEHHSHPANRGRRSPATVHSFYVCDDLRPYSERDPLGQ